MDQYNQQGMEEPAYPSGAMGGGAGAGDPESLGSSRSRDSIEGKVFLGGLNLQTSKETVSEYCQQWGDLADIVVMEGRGFGFVTFADPKNAATFLETKEHNIDGRRVEAKAAVPRSQAPGRDTPTLGNKIFIGGTSNLTEDQVKEYFSQYGNITDCVIVRHPDGGSRGFGFVTFENDSSVSQCAGVKHTISDNSVEVKRAVPREAIDSSGRGGPMRGRGGYGGYGGGRVGGSYGGGYGGYGGYGARSGGSSSMGGYGGYGGMNGMGMYGGYPMSAMAGMGYGGMGMYGMGGMMGMGGYGMPASSAAMGGYGGGYGGAGGASMRGGYGAGAGGAGRYKPY